MAQDLKISQLPVYSLGTDITSLMLAGKIVVPATISENNILNNRGLDIGQLLSLLRVYVDQAASTAVQNIIDQGEIGGGDSSGGSADTTQIQNQITELRNAVYNPSNYPTTYLKLTNGSTNSMYQIVTGIGQNSPYTESNPIIITTSQIVPDNFYVTIQPTTLIHSNGTATTSIQLTIDGSSPYTGGTVGTIVIRTNFVTSNGQYEVTKTISDFVNTTVNSQNEFPIYTTNMSTNIPSTYNVSQVSVTCSISGKELGTSGVYISGGTVSVGMGTIKL